jgi:hypothetical protein
LAIGAPQYRLKKHNFLITGLLVIERPSKSEYASQGEIIAQTVYETIMHHLVQILFLIFINPMADQIDGDTA